MEEIVARTNPNFFNSQDDANEFDARSDAKGVEPEGIKIGTMPDGTVLCFISSERISGVFVFDVTDPYNVQFMVRPSDRSPSLSNIRRCTGVSLEQLILDVAEPEFASSFDVSCLFSRAFGRTTSTVATLAT